MPVLLSAWIPYVLFAAVIVVGVPLLCLLVGDDPPANEITHEQQGEPRRDPDDVLAVAVSPVLTTAGVA